MAGRRFWDFGRERAMARLAKVGFAAAALVAAAAGLSLAAEEGPLGVWLDHTGRGAVEITKCVDAVCGKVVWVADATVHITYTWNRQRIRHVTLEPKELNV